MTGEVRLRTLARGRPGAPLVVFAHGVEGHWASWESVAARLDPGWRLLALQLPWQAGNDYRWRERRPWQWLADGLDLVGELPDQLVAHSFGANAALELLCTGDPRPGRAVMLVCPFYRLPRHQVSWRMFERSRETFVRHLADGVRARLGRRLERLEPDVVDAMVRLVLDRAGPLGFSAVFDTYVASAELELDRVGVPTSVQVGGADPTLPLASAQALAGAIPGARLRVHAERDHFFHVRHAHDIAAEVTGLHAATRVTTKVGEPR
ncbi:alpha/beta fold hydrolase [Amycolatopsis suaedae]|uniref:Alpha/beta hydrolase n=1 Tax=Amycolatopsis suaedae TaxID=2510978 RepID=A0A4Q7J140_9PSEU|nr:alpha/beta hydrolase [Amycolatopsis suaedae]RZQ61091.1 alpha/beta hydrolase [Amycolatopsis suaedae]